MSAGSWEPPEGVAALLHRHADGSDASPDAVAERAAGDGRWRELAAPVTSVMRDPELHPLWRWVACKALCVWAEPAGYDAVADACADPDDVPWRGVAQDRFGRDSTFAELAEAIGEGADLAADRGTGSARLAALSALLGAAARVDLLHGRGQGIADALDDEDSRALSERLRGAADTCERALAGRVEAPVDLSVQLAGLLVGPDEPSAVDAARRLLREHPSREVLLLLSTLVVEGRGEESLLLAGELAGAARELGVDVRLDDALAARQRASRG